MLDRPNACEINDIQKDETEDVLTSRCECNLHRVENRWMEFLARTGPRKLTRRRGIAENAKYAESLKPCENTLGNGDYTLDEEHELHPVVVLTKYFGWAAHMREQFDRIILKFTETTPWNDPVSVEMFMFMSHWYATLYVVIEGWRELDLHDPRIDDLLKSPNVELLKRYRHGVYHFQKTYFDERYMSFLKSPDVVVWVRDLHKGFFDYLEIWFREHEHDGSAKLLK